MAEAAAGARPAAEGARARCQPTDGEVRQRGESMKKDCGSVGGL